MSRASVRAAVVAWFAPPAVDGLNAVYSSKRKIVQAEETYSGSLGSGSGAHAWVYIERKREHRRGFGGPPGPNTGGKKRVVYDVGFVVIFRSVRPKMEDAVDDHDALMDAIEARLRLGRDLGGQVFSAGEGGELGQDDIETLSDMPKQAGQETHVWSVVKFVVTEWLTS
jgi:hypothetical protein